MTLENSGQTNAGYGSNLTFNGKVECEASIMDGTTLHFGACTNLTTVANPISLARLLCERQAQRLSLDRIPPMILSGDGASEYARHFGLQMVEPQALISRKARKAFEHYRKRIDEYEDTFSVRVTALDTVGAVVVDAYGNCVAGSSSGGLILKLSGRVGQSACYGAGCYAVKDENRAIATCTTGNGEYLMKTLMAREIVNSIRTESDPLMAIYKTFDTNFVSSPFLRPYGEVYGGALSLMYDASTGDCELLWGHTTQAMCIGYMATTSNKPQVSTHTFAFCRPQRTWRFSNVCFNLLRLQFVYSALENDKIPGRSISVQGKHFKLPI